MIEEEEHKLNGKTRDVLSIFVTVGVTAVLGIASWNLNATIDMGREISSFMGSANSRISALERSGEKAGEERDELSDLKMMMPELKMLERRIANLEKR